MLAGTEEHTLSWCTVDAITEKYRQRQKDRFPAYTEDIQKNADRDRRTHFQLMYMTSQKKADKDRRTDSQLIQRTFRRVLAGTEEHTLSWCLWRHSKRLTETEGQIPLAYIEDITEEHALTGTEGQIPACEFDITEGYWQGQKDRVPACLENKTKIVPTGTEVHIHSYCTLPTSLPVTSFRQRTHTQTQTRTHRALSW